jgi:hypothetical protein
MAHMMLRVGSPVVFFTKEHGIKLGQPQKAEWETAGMWCGDPGIRLGKLVGWRIQKHEGSPQKVSTKPQWSCNQLQLLHWALRGRQCRLGTDCNTNPLRET